jgi:RNA polymerase sigma factor (sigma-70 family)
MTPFREKPVEWDGDDDNGRYKNRGGFKYDIVTKTVVKKAEHMPKCYLADTQKEAEAIYSQFEKVLNKLAYSYAIGTGLNKSDLFGEGLIGLGRAYRDWDPKRSDDFRAYAVFRIKDALGEFVRDNASAISVPSYIKKAHANIREIKAICEAADIDHHMVIDEQELPDELETNDAVRCAELVSNLINAANRAGIGYKKFLERIKLIPEDVEYIDQTPPEIHRREIEMLEAAIVVEKLKDHMDDTELAICEGIMLDKSYDEIGKELGKSKAWVSGKLKALKERILEMMHQGKL